MQQLFPRTRSDLSDADLGELLAWPERTWVRANMAHSVDGAITGTGGLSRAVSSAADRRLFSLLRGRADAILVGAGTARAEHYGPARSRADFAGDRQAAGQGEVPVIAIVTRTAHLNPAWPLFTESPARPIVYTAGAARAADVEALRPVADVVAGPDATLDLAAVIADLARRGLRRILTEGGPRLLTDLLHDNLVDELFVTTTPKVIGGLARSADGQTLFAPGRMTADRFLPDTPVNVRLSRLLEDDGTLMASWLVGD